MKTYSKFFVSAMIGLLSVSAHAFNAETSSINSAKLIFGEQNKYGNIVESDEDIGGNTLALGKSTYDEASAVIEVVSYDDEMNSRTIRIPVLVRMKSNGLLAHQHIGSSLGLHGLKGKSLESVLGTYRGGTIAVGAFLNLGARAFVHTGKSGIFITDFERPFGLGVEVSGNKLIIMPKSEASNVSISVTDNGANHSTQETVAMPDARDLKF